MEQDSTNPRSSREQTPFKIVVQKKKTDKVPRVTVAISLFNYKRYIIECLESVRVQTIKDLDLIIVDDCSTDASLDTTHRWLMKKGGRFSSYKLMKHDKNSGLSRTRNTGFANSRTKNVFVLDADNILYPRCLEKLDTALENCDASFAYCYLEKFGDVNCLQNTKPWNPSTLKDGNTIDAMVLLRKRVWEVIGGYSRDMLMGWEDFELWFKIANAKGWGLLVPEILAKYRVHGASMLNTVTNPNIEKLWAHLRKYYKEFFQENRA